MTQTKSKPRQITVEDLLKLDPDEMLKYDETPSIEALKDKKQLYFDDVQIGQELPKYVRRHSIVELTRWCITMENTHRLHYDYAFAHNQDNLPGVLFHGTWRMSIVAAWLKNWSLPGGWFWKASWQVREMVTAGETIILWGNVIDKKVKDGMGLVEIEFGMKNEEGWEGAPGKATVALPIKGGRPIPYPFVPPAG